MGEQMQRSKVGIVVNMTDRRVSFGDASALLSHGQFPFQARLGPILVLRWTAQAIPVAVSMHLSSAFSFGLRCTTLPTRICIVYTPTVDHSP
jgi:hypothetical protein